VNPKEEEDEAQEENDLWTGWNERVLVVNPFETTYHHSLDTSLSTRKLFL
jgi:hypothetical protein